MKYDFLRRSFKHCRCIVLSYGKSHPWNQYSDQPSAIKLHIQLLATRDLGVHFVLCFPNLKKKKKFLQLFFFLLVSYSITQAWFWLSSLPESLGKSQDNPAGSDMHLRSFHHDSTYCVHPAPMLLCSGLHFCHFQSVKLAPFSEVAAPGFSVLLLLHWGITMRLCDSWAQMNSYLNFSTAGGIAHLLPVTVMSRWLTSSLTVTSI